LIILLFIKTKNERSGSNLAGFALGNTILAILDPHYTGSFELKSSEGKNTT